MFRLFKHQALAALVVAAALVLPSMARADGAPAGPQLLDDPRAIEAGKAIWQKQCRHCHGRSAYPGKAPKLKPRKYKPDFVFDRVTNGFRKMPAWKDVFDDEQRWSIVAFVLSKSFSP